MKAASDTINVKLFDMVMSFSRAMDLLHPSISEHHLRVAYSAACIAEELGLPEQTVHDVLVAGALHDVAAACAPSARPLLDHALQNDTSGNADTRKVHDHAHECYLLLREFEPFARAAAAIRFHHVDWSHGNGRYYEGQPVPLQSHILRLADRVAVLPMDATPILAQASIIRDAVRQRAGPRFHPELVLAFERLSLKEAFWLDLVSRHKEMVLRERFSGESIFLDLDSLYDLARVFAKIVDYRSAYTAVHSSNVAKSSELLAARVGLPDRSVRLIGIAGYLHDIGKLSVPTAILEKPGKLSPEETLLVRQHPYYTQQILSAVQGLGNVCTWASLHHERLDGSGYPFRRRQVPLEARIVAVADVFTAITEDRPYRKGMSKAECMHVLDQLVADGAIDGDVVSLLRPEYDALLAVRTRDALCRMESGRECQTAVNQNSGILNID